jgi:uncharacterized phiE125 gp8 family phage protein
MGAKLIIGPKSEPITLDEAKAHLRIDEDITADDALIDLLIGTARKSAESMTRRALLPQTWELALDRFEKVIRLPRPPLIEIESIKFVDPGGTLQTLNAGFYQVDSHSEPARLLPAYGTAWPATRPQANAVVIRYTAGYSNAAAVPDEIKQWMLLQIGTMHANPEGVVVGVSVAPLPHVDRLLDELTIRGF